MRKFIIWIVLAAIFGIAVGAAGVWAINKRMAQSGHVVAEHSKEKTDEALADYTLWLMLFTGVLAIATIGLGVATTGLYSTGEKQVEITRQALVGDQRAWIVTELEIGKGGVTITDGHISVDARLKVMNVGRTPALRAHTSMTILTDVLTTATKVRDF